MNPNLLQALIAMSVIGNTRPEVVVVGSPDPKPAAPYWRRPLVDTRTPKLTLIEGFHGEEAERQVCAQKLSAKDQAIVDAFRARKIANKLRTAQRGKENT